MIDDKPEILKKKAENKGGFRIDIMTYDSTEFFHVIGENEALYSLALQGWDIIDEDSGLGGTIIEINTLNDLFGIMNLLRDTQCSIQLKYSLRHDQVSIDARLNTTPVDHMRGGKAYHEQISIHEHNINQHMRDKIVQAVKILKG